MSIVVLCAGGHARVVIEALLSRGQRPVSATDRDAARRGETILGVRIIGPDDDVLAMDVSSTELVNGLGNKASRTKSGLAARRDLFTRFKSADYNFATVVHASATVASDVVLGEGAQVMAGAIIQPGATIGDNTIVNTRAVVEHDCQIGQHSHIAPGAILCGAAKIGEDVHVGAGAIVLGGVNIGDGCVVAAGAVVTKSLAAGSFAGCTQGRKI